MIVARCCTFDMIFFNAKSKFGRFAKGVDFVIVVHSRLYI